MDSILRSKLIKIARGKYLSDDPSHDFQHIFRVLRIAEKIATDESADLDIVVPAALFHDIINYPKNDPRAKNSSTESAEITKQLLGKIGEYPKEKIFYVWTAIDSCSFSKGIRPDLLEAKILQDADGLEATGALSIMRTFASSGIMKRTFYDPEDPMAKRREFDDRSYALDLFFTRLLKVIDRMHTVSARKIAKRRTVFLGKFLKELTEELRETGHNL